MSDRRRSDDEEHPRRSSWLTFGLPASVAAILLSVVVYIFTVGHEIGRMGTQLDLVVLRVDALEQRGSGPVQQSAERVAQMQARVDRILAELLDTQKRLAEIASTQARDGQKIVNLERAQR